MAGLFFLGTCSHCRRPSEIEVQKLGKKIDCVFCGRAFMAVDRNNQSAALDDPVNYWVRFTDHSASSIDFDALPDRDVHRTPR